MTLWDLLEPLKRRIVEAFHAGARPAPPPQPPRQPQSQPRPQPSRRKPITPNAQSRGRRNQSTGLQAPAANRAAPPAPSLFDRPNPRKRRPRHPPPTTPPSPAPTTPPTRAPAPAPAPANMDARYDHVVELMLARYNVRVRKWRSSMSGVAWQVTYRDGRIANLIEAPRPKGPMSAAVFLHEIGHHAIGLGTFKPRCLEEYHAWKFAIDQMEFHGLNITDSVRTRMRRSLEYAVAKAARRGIKSLPAELAPFIPGRYQNRFSS